MSRSSYRICNVPGCPEYTRDGRCAEHRAQAEARRGTATQRGYGRRHRTRFRRIVLARDPVCRCSGCTSCSQPGQDCARNSEHADHWPLDRRDLVARGMDPDDPEHGRGLCRRCHSQATAQHQPGGWADRDSQ